jgi:hypothetical protein
MVRAVGVRNMWVTSGWRGYWACMRRELVLVEEVDK